MHYCFWDNEILFSKSKYRENYAYDTYCIINEQIGINNIINAYLKCWCGKHMTAGYSKGKLKY